MEQNYTSLLLYVCSHDVSITRPHLYAWHKMRPIVTDVPWSVSVCLCLCVKANLHRDARHDKTVSSVSRPLRRCELDSRQLKTVADKKFEVWTRSEQSSNSRRHTRHDTDRTVLSRLVGGVNSALRPLVSRAMSWSWCHAGCGLRWAKEARNICGLSQLDPSARTRTFDHEGGFHPHDR